MEYQRTRIRILKKWKIERGKERERDRARARARERERERERAVNKSKLLDTYFYFGWFVGNG